VILSSRTPALPSLDAREDHPAVDYWAREDYNRAEESRSLGETVGDITLITEPNTGSAQASSHSKHYYLQRHDGTPVSKKEVASLSFKARSLWATLKEEGRAPKTFGKISSSAWDFFLRTMVADPDFSFLRWCDDGEWKLREWATQNYSSWAYNVGLRAKKNTQPKIKDDRALNDSTLIRMSPGSCQNEDDGNDEEDSVNRIGEASLVSADGGRDTDSLTQRAGEGNPSSQTQPVRRLPLDYSAHQHVFRHHSHTLTQPFWVLKTSCNIFIMLSHRLLIAIHQRTQVHNCSH
jgi:hypothetical protein